MCCQNGNPLYLALRPSRTPPVCANFALPGVTERFDGGGQPTASACNAIAVNAPLPACDPMIMKSELRVSGQQRYAMVGFTPVSQKKGSPPASSVQSFDATRIFTTCLASRR